MMMMMIWISNFFFFATNNNNHSDLVMVKLCHTIVLFGRLEKNWFLIRNQCLWVCVCASIMMMTKNLLYKYEKNRSIERVRKKICKLRIELIIDKCFLINRVEIVLLKKKFNGHFFLLERVNFVSLVWFDDHLLYCVWWINVKLCIGWWEIKTEKNEKLMKPRETRHFE